LHALLICPKTSVSSGACYRRYDETATDFSDGGATEKAIAALTGENPNEAGRYLMNDLYIPASSLCSDVKKALEEAQSFSPLSAVMTGSGSAVLALFETEELCRWAKSRYRGKFKTEVIKTLDPHAKKPIWATPFALRKEEIEE
jgi:4-diphosphocytidyl-2C-methyl-D-erythritol kinase